MKTVLKYPGSKWSTAEWIISNFPRNYKKMTYLESHFGSGGVFFQKERSVIETINDLDGNVVNLFRVIREHPEELARLIEFTPWSRQEYRLSYEMTGNSIEDARRFLVRMWQAIGAKSSDSTGWRNNIQANNGNLTQFSLRLPKYITAAAERLKHTSGCLVQIENQPAIRLIERHRKENVLIYADPPYVLSTRHGRIYKHEMSDADHVELLETLMLHPGPVIISGYENELYLRMLRGWRTEKRIARCEAGQKREEVIWMNYNSDRASLF
ncbi:DNA adenine methylase [Desulfosporosinus youngiae]|uniref:Site-specific DNA methylase n=1 Tax=Desulfosporosinus youngiae DSM 17734 TaxID=768710 RepID=H5XZX2_9FIRM|nr:DNA adenine methylase [Desulfosporosinus youngiae]EHQ92168.1 site-specific DNA methylase [Desulfosporosinus youngiae DSM 17734]